MKRHPWVLATFIGILATGCVSRGEYNSKVDELRQAKAQLRSVSDLAQQYGSQLAELEGEKSALENQNSMLRSNHDDATRRIDELLAEIQGMKAQPTLEGVDVDVEPGAFVYRVDGGFLFDPGKSDLKPSGKKTLGEVANRLRENNYKIEVAGHTDSDPVAKTIKDYPNGNIELGAKRALAVWRALKDAGVPESRMNISSYGEHRPKAKGDKATNRRVEIRVLLQEPMASG